MALLTWLLTQAPSFPSYFAVPRGHHRKRDLPRRLSLAYHLTMAPQAVEGSTFSPRGTSNTTSRSAAVRQGRPGGRYRQAAMRKPYNRRRGDVSCLIDKSVHIQRISGIVGLPSPLAYAQRQLPYVQQSG